MTRDLRGALDVDRVSAREAEVLEGLSEHLTNAQIARRLHISVRTVESHVSSLLRKLGADSRIELALRAPAPSTPASVALAFVVANRWTSFVGRTGEIDDVVAAMSTSRLITLVGPGGIGKTSLAHAVVERVAPAFSAGGGFVDLVPVSADFVVEAVAASLGVAQRPQEPLADAVQERLRMGPTLLVLDNCEHVREATATFAYRILTSCPGTVVLATSRERLGITGERIVAVPPLSLTPNSEGSAPDAVRLFLDRSQSASDYDVDQTMVTEICRRLDGIPLAIELAAARAASLGVDGLLAGLDDHLRLLTSGATGRHQSTRALIDWSYDLLDQQDRAFFRRIACFAGSFDLASAAAVAADGDVAAATDLVGRLVDKSLLVRTSDGAGSRRRMLETVHAYRPSATERGA